MTQYVPAHSRLPQSPAVHTGVPPFHPELTGILLNRPGSAWPVKHVPQRNNSSCQLVPYTAFVTTSHTQGRSQEKKVSVSNFSDGPHTSAEIVTKFSKADGPKSQAES